MTLARRTRVVALAVLAAGATLVGVGLWLVLRSDGGSPAPAGALGAVLGDQRPATAPFAGLTEVQLAVAGDCRRLVVADAEGERATGLMRRRDLGPYAGMLFVFDGPTQDAFTMSEVPVPLDIGFYDAHGRQVDQLVMQPCPDRPVAECPTYRAHRSYRYALETLRGGLPSGGLGSCPS